MIAVFEVLFRRAAAEFPEDEGAEGEVEEGAAEEAEEDDDGDFVVTLQKVIELPR